MSAHWSITAIAALGVIVIAILSIGIGSVSIPPLTAIKILLSHLPLLNINPVWSDTFQAILFDIRLPRVVLIALTGAALATSGTAYQSLFRNPLADPYLIGVAAGASLGATVIIAMQVAHPTVINAFAVPLGAFIGATATVALVYQLGRIGRGVPTTTLILAGVAIGSLAVALNTFLFLSMGERTTRLFAFLLGGYAGSGWNAVFAVAFFAMIGFVIMYIHARPLNILLFDEEQAQQLGIHVERVKVIVIVAATLTTAAAVAFSGLIGFVGLIVPHAARFLIGPDHRRLLPLASLFGAGFLMLADLIARTIHAPEEVPLGIVTAFVGAPFFLYMLRRAKHAAFF
ncbi:iron ABC transporter permease [bacterium]|nr:iron ABC transporter permease [bacterium]